MNKRSIILEGELLQKLRRQACMTGQDAADEIGISLNTLKKAEKSKAILLATARLIVNYYDIPLQEMCGDSDGISNSNFSLNKPESRSQSYSVDRWQEISQIEQVIANTSASNRASLINVVGVSGIGKTYFLEQLSERLATGGNLCLNYFLDNSSRWKMWCREVLTDLAQQDTLSTMNQVYRSDFDSEDSLFLYLYHVRKTVVLCLDDLHLTELRFATHLFRFLSRIESLPVTILFTSSQEAGSLDRVIRRSMLTVQFTYLQLSPLSHRQLRKISDSYPKLDEFDIERAIEESAGIPLLFMEQLNFLSGGTARADVVYQSIEYKLDKLSIHQYEVLELMAVVNEPLSLFEIHTMISKIRRKRAEADEYTDYTDPIELFLVTKDELSQVSIFHPTISRAIYGRMTAQKKLECHYAAAEFFYSRDQRAYEKHLLKAGLHNDKFIDEEKFNIIQQFLDGASVNAAIDEIDSLLHEAPCIQDQARLHRLKAHAMDLMLSFEPSFEPSQIALDVTVNETLISL